MKVLFAISFVFMLQVTSFAQHTYSNTLLCMRGADLKVTMPNVFTPNNDYKNDNFVPIVINELCLDEYYLVVYNTWGQQLYESYVYSQGWNGNDVAGNPYNEGTYYYMVSYKYFSLGDTKIKSDSQKGFFLLAR